MATKAEMENKKELARLYYLQGETHKSIAAKTGVSEVTIGKWVDKGGWEAKRAGINVTRPEIVNKNLVLISKLLDRLNEEEIDLKDVGKIVDQISKLAAAIERIDKKANVIDAIEVFTALNKWLEQRMQWDDKITPELLRQFNYYHELYISEQITK
ncbi:MAG: terminase [Bacteroidales bacterium]|nr:terminase [Bacteroidales bacterium]